MARWEGSFLLWLQERMRTPCLTAFFRAITRLTDGGTIWIAISLGLLFFKKTRHAGIVCIATLIAEFVIVNVFIKQIVGRIRPFDRFHNLQPLINPPRDFSFPSGHTGVAFATTGALLFLGYKRTSLSLLVYATLVGFSRVYLGVHYLTDVLGGALIGTLVAYGVHLIAP